MDRARLTAAADDGVAGDRAARGEARKATTSATSAASTSRWIELRTRLSSASAGEMPRLLARRSTTPGVASVRVSPGWTTVTVIPAGPSSSARFFVSAATATLRIEPMTDPVLRAPRPEMLMIRPQPWAIIAGATAWAQRRYPSTLTFMSSQNSSAVTSASFGGAAWPSGLAALLTRTSTPPSSAVAAATIARTDSSSPVSTTTGTTARPVEARSSTAAASERVATAGGDDDVAALVAERPGDRLADAPAAAGDDGPLAGELEIHRPRLARPRRTTVTQP